MQDESLTDKQIISSNDQSNQDRRQHARSRISCAIVIYGPTGRRELARTRTENVSDGGCYVIIEKSAPHEWIWVPRRCDESPLIMELKVPRQTANTYMLEPVRSAGRIVRIERPPLKRQSTTARGADLGLALQFKNPLELQLE